MKVVFCWSGMSGYMAACWRELAKREGISTALLIQWWSMPWAPELLSGLPDLRRISKAENNNDALVRQLVREQKPDIIVICGWAYRCFRKLAFYPEFAKCRFILAMDNPWQGTWRQRLARLKVGRLVDRMDAVAVTGERCYQFARHLRVPESKIMRGTYGIDFGHFDEIRKRRLHERAGWPKRFLYTGRFAAVKGLDVLVEAYRRYRQQVADPWPLSCCGRGPLQKLLAGVAGIEDHGFVQPHEMAAIYAAAGAFVMPSRYDPWPLAIVEASAAGLPIVCTEACGSAVEIVRPYYSGIGVPTDDASALCSAFIWLHEHYDILPQYGHRASQLAEAYSATAWADRWTERFVSLTT